MKKTVGILAHVDAGKTTLSERVLYAAGVVRAPGRVDHGDTCLDDDPMERLRGITIYARLARLCLGADEIYWLDTPGHTDFTPEMERALSVLDAAVLVVSAAEGIQSHTETLWRMLAAHHVPTFIFLNKLDLAAADAERVIAALRKRLSPDILDLRGWQRSGRMDLALTEEIALREESLLPLLETERPPEAPFARSLASLTMARSVFPLMAGVALTGEGVEAFLRILNELVVTDRDAGKPLSAVCWKITRDESGQRLCHLKLLSGTLRVKESLGEAKVNDLRLWDGSRLKRGTEASAGDMIAVGGLESVRAGDAFGDAAPLRFLTDPMIAADVRWEGAAETQVLRALRQIEDEEPSYRVEAADGRISIRVMGPIQLEILQAVAEKRFGLKLSFGGYRVLYRETVAAPAVGIGHYEPLRHYAEVWVRLVPLPAGSGVRFRSLCHVDDLPLHFQRLIETHVFEKEHRGVLTGAPLTDVEVQLLIGRSHPKHTEGGDFRQATCRAIRNALMHAESVLLEPIAGFELTVPAASYGAVMGSLQGIRARTDGVETSEETLRITGEAPYAAFRKWQEGYAAMTHGRGSLRVWTSRYAPCADAEAVIAEAAYRPLAHLEDTPESVFCAHGAGFNVAWDKVKDFAHCAWEEQT